METAATPGPMIVVAGALIGPDGRIAMHRRPEGKHHGGLWEFPGGKMERGEAPEQVLVRELAEELAVRIDPGDMVPAGFVSSPDAGPDGRAILLLLYTCRRWSGEPVAQEGGQVRWMAQADIAALELAPLDRKLLQFGGLPGSA